MGTKQPRRRYSPEYKADAIKLWRESGETQEAIAHRLGIHPTTLWGWVKQADIDDGKREGMSTADKERIAELEKKLKVVTMERVLMKKATAFFARESEK